ncbi:MAG: sensor histidine kinase, partial [Verrucomicrobiales bacterium]
MHRQALRLLKLINDLLDIAKLESGQLELRFEMVSVREFVNSLVESIAELARQRNLTVTAHIGEGVTLIQADRDKLEKICLNLLLNAIKFTPEFGRIHLGVRLEGG